jgi:hypothetical protein
MSTTSPRHQLWADEVEEEEAVERMAKGDYASRGDWHPGLEVQRGQARQRLDLTHGFVKNIVRLNRRGVFSPLCSVQGCCAVMLRFEMVEGRINEYSRKAVVFVEDADAVRQ